ncbi:hypothetical protein P0D88_49720 [Paraburkholderia sp. RL18-103-BIB-C]|jgi:hypothetical protein|uniref:hypothetical protein n=1 Tax=unclassified Paraburkholderia TaxID=2615204 RepID=UPI0038B992A7
MDIAVRADCPEIQFRQLRVSPGSLRKSPSRGFDLQEVDASADVACREHRSQLPPALEITV